MVQGEGRVPALICKFLHYSWTHAQITWYPKFESLTEKARKVMLFFESCGIM